MEVDESSPVSNLKSYIQQIIDEEVSKYEDPTEKGHIFLK